MDTTDRLLVIILVIVAVFVASITRTPHPAHGAERCLPNGVPGECITAAEYDRLYSAEHLATVESIALEGRSVADVYSLPVTPRASERPRAFMGEELPTFARVLELRGELVVVAL